MRDRIRICQEAGNQWTAPPINYETIDYNSSYAEPSLNPSWSLSSHLLLMRLKAVRFGERQMLIFSLLLTTLSMALLIPWGSSKPKTWFVVYESARQGQIDRELSGHLIFKGQE